jgi:hypothetical protein
MRCSTPTTFDQFVEGLCPKFYAKLMGRPSLQPERYFRLLLVGYFEGIDSERGIAWRATDSLAVRTFLRLPLDEGPPDHSTISRTRRAIDLETHRAVFTWVQVRADPARRRARRGARGDHDRSRGLSTFLRRAIFPACKRLGLPKGTWLTFRRTYSLSSHDKGVPGKITAQLMGHASVDTTLNVYTQVLDGSVREAVDTVGNELFKLLTNRGVSRRGRSGR